MEEKEIVSNPQNEMFFIGSLFLDNDLFLEYDKVIVPGYYFTDELCLSLYEWLSVLFVNEQKFTEKNLVVYVTQDSNKLEKYKSFGGWKTIEGFMEISDVSEFRSYFQTIQKYALCREMESKGFDTSKIRKHKNFEKATTSEVYRKIRAVIDKVHTSVTADVEIENITEETSKMVEGFVDIPAMGIPTFLLTYNELFLGFRKKSMMGFGLMSNFGKTRFLAKIAAYNSLIQKEKTLLMLNEMSGDQLKVAVLTTVINNPEFKHLHGIELNKIEKEIKLGLYRDGDGNFVQRKVDKEGNFEEGLKEYKKRLMESSREYRDVLLISKWLEEDCFKGMLAVLDVKRDYSDFALANQMKKAARKGYGFVAYDNLKNDKENLGMWAKLIATTTTLSETAKDEGIFCWASLQLTDDTSSIDVMDLDSNNISASKGLKTVLDSLILGKVIEKEKYKKYRYIPTGNNNFGDRSKIPLPLPDNDKYVLQGHVPDKNREGSKQPILVAVDLDTNQWIERGLLMRA